MIACMLTSARPVAFIPSTDLDRSRAFYEAVLGLPVVGADEFAVVLDADGVMVRVTHVGDRFHVQPFTVFGWCVADVHATVAALRDRGVGVRRYDGMGQDDAGVWTAPSGTRIAWFQDPDGNTLSVSD
jgi:catechol 2,3-dioxygenase-like lactoylglutathione lyase family enzyme